MPTLKVSVYGLKSFADIKALWSMFAPHHYLSGELRPNCKAFVAAWDDELFGFTSSIPQPSGTMQRAWREHRTVILPDYQGMGLGLRLSEWLGEYHLLRGERLYSRTVHPRMGQAREASSRWRATRWNLEARPDDRWTTMAGTRRAAYAHEYVG